VSGPVRGLWSASEAGLSLVPQLGAADSPASLLGAPSDTVYTALPMVTAACNATTMPSLLRASHRTHGGDTSDGFSRNTPSRRATCTGWALLE
jgi:hypothetical protein